MADGSDEYTEFINMSIGLQSKYNPADKTEVTMGMPSVDGLTDAANISALLHATTRLKNYQVIEINRTDTKGL
jgi:hypothetical protein